MIEGGYFGQIGLRRSGLKKILIIDDSLMVRTAMTACVQKAGYQALTAAHGKEALELLFDSPDISLIFLDVHMPIMDGFEMLEALGASELANTFPIIMLTTENMERYRDKVKQYGVKAWVEKPANFDKIVEYIDKLAK